MVDRERDIYERVAMVEQAVISLTEESRRARNRIHKLETGQAAVQLLAERLTFHIDRVDNLVNEMRTLRKTLLGFGFSIVSAAIAFSLTVLLTL